MSADQPAVPRQPRVQRAGTPEPAPGVLYLVGTPIGHRGDLSPRARRILAAVDAIACEDTRRTGRLLQDLADPGRAAADEGRHPPLLSFHRHNRARRQPQLLERLEQGQSLALVSDAGLPGISDPGEELVAAARAAGHPVVCVPGPCALTTALVSSGLPCGRFCFEGFLPARPRERRQRLAELRQERRTVVLYEAPHRLCALLEDLLELLGDRPLQVSRELTKRHEESVGPTVAAVRQHFRSTPPQGEVTLVLGGAAAAAEPPWSESRLRQALAEELAGGAAASAAARAVARRSGRSRRELYGLLHGSPPEADG